MHADDTQDLVAAPNYDVVDGRVTQYSNVALLLKSRPSDKILLLSAFFKHV